MGGFSVRNRTTYLEEMATRELDLLVIGGGITGAGIALDAQVRGLQTGIVEMQDFASGTSSRSTKLIHGGLRYLKQLEIKLVAEVGKERAIVYENAPHVTTPIWMMLPIIEGGTYGLLSTSIGLKVYDKLAGVRKDERRIMLNKEQALKKEPLLRSDNLKGAGYYVEYRTDDARLTIEVVKKAVSLGSKAVNYAKVEEFIYQNGKVVGVNVRDQISGKQFKIYARKIVNATGPWVDLLREKDGSRQGKSLNLTKGVHLVVSGSRFPLKQAVYFDTPDGRMVFAIPRDTKTYIGTTDTDYTGDYANPRMSTADMEYILRAVNFMFPTVNLGPNDIESSWAGLRPLIHEDGKSPSELSRKDEVFISPTGLISIAGGKLTGYRKMAERVVDIVCKEISDRLNQSYPPCTTDKITLSGGDVGGPTGLESFANMHVSRGTGLGLSEREAMTLVNRYGSNVDLVFKIIESEGAQATNYGLPVAILASVIYGMEHEMVTCPDDFFVRRTGAVFFDMPWVNTWKIPVVRFMSDWLSWGKRSELMQDRLEGTLEEATHAVQQAELVGV